MIDAQNDSYDVIVVGGGGTGLAAAIEAAGAGARTVLFEKNPALGGSTGWSVGSISVSATPHQAAKGVVDGPEDHWRDMALFNGALDGRDNPALRRVLTEELPEHVSLAAVARHPLLRADAGTAAYQAAHA